MYMDGLKVFSFNFQSKAEILPADAFENIRFGWNMRGSLTDLQIYPTFFDESNLISLTTSCGGKGGEIFTWDKAKVNIIKVQSIFMRNFWMPVKDVIKQILGQK